MAEKTGGRWSVPGRFPDFRRLFLGNSVSLLGSSVTTVALPLAAVGYLHASPVQMGVLGAVAFLPHLVFGLPAGVWVDRLPYRRILVFADLAQFVLIGAIPLLAAFGALRIWQLYVIVVAAGIGNLFETVTAQSFTPNLVPREQLLRANSALMLSNATVGTSGAALGSALVTVLAAPLAIVVDAASFLLAALCKARIGTPGPQVRRRSIGPRQLGRDILDGLRAVLADRIVRTVTIAATIGALAGQLQNVVLVLFLYRDLRLTDGAIGLVITVGGVAGIACALFAPRITRRIGPGPAFVLGMFVAALAGGVLALAGGAWYVTVPVVVAGQLLRGAGPALYGINQQTFRQAFIPPDLLSRANATWRFPVYGMQPIGALLGGVLGSIDLRATLVVGSVVMLLGTAIALVSPLRTLRDLG